MSEEPELSAAVETIQESIAQTIDADEVESMLEGESTFQAVGRDLGSRVGRELGSIIGRELGAIVAVDVRERKSLRTILGDVTRRLFELLAAVFRNADIESAVSRLVDLGGSVVSDGAPGELLETVAPGDDGGEDDPDAGDDATVSDLSADDLRELREETYRDLLELMSYRDLQSIAKEVGVKANVSQEEMVDRIIEQFSEGTDE